MHIMEKKHHNNGPDHDPTTDPDGVLAADRGFYDPEPLDEKDLWFLPGADIGADRAQMPGPQADQTPLVDVASWTAAEAALARPLADLAGQVGQLTARIAAGPAGWRQRLALQEAADLSWLAGDRVPPDRLALWQVLRLQGDADDSQALLRAGWAVRRLTAPQGPGDDLGVFLGRKDPGDARQLQDQIADWHEIMGQGRGLHPLTQAALSFHGWPLTGLSAGHVLGGAAPLPLMEAAVVAARLAMGHTPETGVLFLPLALGGAAGLRATGSAEHRLARWLAGAGQGVRAALRQLDQLAAWDARAQQACAGLSGRTPPQLITLLRDWPLVSARMAEAESDASRAAIQRNLNRLVDLGVAREVTGQGRYRFWAAAL